MSEQLKTRPDQVLEDPGALAVASQYARSYLSAAASQDSDDAEEELGSFVDDVLAGNPDFRTLLTSDSVGRKAKLDLVDRVISPRSSEFFVNFLKVLIRHGRMELIDEIREVVIRVREELANQQRVQIRSSQPLTDKSRQRVIRQL
jgi:ATP synthase F1 delta subunit